MLMTTKTRGRPTVFDQETVHKLEQAFNIGCTVEEACTVSGVSRSAYYKKIETDHDFMDKMERSKLLAILMARQTVVKEIKAGNVKVAMWYLERKCKKEFGRTVHHEQVLDTSFDTTSYEELRRLIEC